MSTLADAILSLEDFPLVTKVTNTTFDNTMTDVREAMDPLASALSSTSEAMTSTSYIENSPLLTEFTLFPTLPLELRRMIWNLTFPAPRTVLITLSKQDDDHLEQFSTSPIVGLSVNRDSRAEALRNYGVILFPAMGASLVIGNNDTIELLGSEMELSSPDYLELIAKVNDVLHGGLAAIEHMKIESLISCTRPSNESMRVRLILCQFSALKSLGVSILNVGQEETTKAELLRAFGENSMVRVPEVIVQCPFANKREFLMSMLSRLRAEDSTNHQRTIQELRGFGNGY